MFEVATLLLLTWGALAFGAEYAWAYTPLLLFSLVPTVLGLRATRGAPPSRLLMLAFGLVFMAGVVQVVGPARLVPTAWQAPPAVEFGRLYALVTMQPQPTEPNTAISIAPARTMLGLTFLAAFALLLAGCTRAVSAFGPKRLIRGLIVLGTVVAFVGLIQRAVQAEEIYGFWRQPRAGVPFAPFMNENHFTGWMAMVVSLAIGSFAGDVAVALKHVVGWRNRVLWFSSPRASGMILTAFAVAVMALSMVIATSRGGLVGLVLIFLMGLWWMLRRQAGLRRVIGGVSLLAIIMLATSWGGAGRTIDQFIGATENLGGRKEIWNDTWRIIKDYPVTGTGLNTYGIAMLHYQTDSIARGAVTEAHNDYLHLAAEGGVLLGVPILLVLGVFGRQVWTRFRDGSDDAETYWLRAGAVTGLCAIAVMEIFDFTLQMPGAAAMFVVLAAIAIHQPNYLARRG